jgi:type IV pilus assembly protein PilQ
MMGRVAGTRLVRWMCRVARCVGLLIGLLGTLSLAQGQPVLQQLLLSGEGEHDVLRLEFSQPLFEDPIGLLQHMPARLTLDFVGLRNGVPAQAGAQSHRNVRGVQLSESGGRTRITLDLQRALPYSLRREGRTLYVLIGGDSAAQSDGLAPLEQAWRQLPDPALGLLQHIDFRRGEGGAGRLIVELPSDQTRVDMHQHGQTLVVNFARSRLAEGLSRRMDVRDFGTPVEAITSSERGAQVRLVIDAQGDWEYFAQQRGRELVIEVQLRPRNPAGASGLPAFTGARLTLNVQDVEVRELLHVIADFTQLNIIASDAVAGRLTLRLQDVPWDQALDIILQARNLGMRRNGTVLWIAPREELLAKERADLEAQAAIRALEPLVTRAFQLNYSKATEIAAQLSSSGSTGTAAVGTRLLSPRGSVVAEPRTNQIFVSDIPSKIADLQDLLLRLDVPVRQVMIEARIVEASDTFGRSLGVRLGVSDLRAANGGEAGSSIGGGNRVAVGSNYSNAVASSGQGGTVDTSANMVNLPASSSTGASVATFAVSIFSSSANRFLNLELSALESDGKGKIVSSPRVVTADQRKAVIEQGTEIPYQEATSSGATSVSYREANLKLEVTPQITPEGNIIMNLSVNKDSVGEETENGLAINTKHVQTQVLVENGGTVVIGGIYEMSESVSADKVPVLGDIPVLGALFRSQTRSSSKQEMLVFITPKVVVDHRAALR